MLLEPGASVGVDDLRAVGPLASPATYHQKFTKRPGLPAANLLKYSDQLSFLASYYPQYTD